MTQGIQYRTRFEGVAPGTRTAGATTTSQDAISCQDARLPAEFGQRTRIPAASGEGQAQRRFGPRFVQVLQQLWRQRWFRWLADVPDALIGDVPRGPHSVAKELRSQLNLLDSSLHVRFY